MARARWSPATELRRSNSSNLSPGISRGFFVPRNFLSLLLSRCLRWLRLWFCVSQPVDVRALPPAVVPAFAAGLAIQRGFQFPDRFIRRMLERAERDQRNTVAAVAVGLK